MKTILAGVAALAMTTTAALAAGHGAGSMGTGHAPTMTPAMSSPSSQPTTPSGNTRALGQPNQSCGSATAPNTPGNAASAPGSAFNPNGTAGSHYAGEQPQNSNNPAAVSQYDSACAHQ